MKKLLSSLVEKVGGKDNDRLDGGFGSLKGGTGLKVLEEMPTHTGCSNPNICNSTNLANCVNATCTGAVNRSGTCSNTVSC